jgi:hypothetical protein
VEDGRLKTLHDLLDEAVALQQQTSRLVAEITDQIQRSIFLHNDSGRAILRPKRDRRLTPRH